MIGLSLSFCVQDIIQGKVKESEVERIIAGTMAGPGQWDKVIEIYTTLYWYDNPVEAQRIAWRLVALQKVDQPRLRGEAPYNIAASVGHWAADFDELAAHPKAW